MNMRYVAWSVAAAVLAGVVLYAPYGADQDGQAVRVAFFPNLGHAIPIVGTETGFFNHTRVETRIFDSGPQAVESLFAGSTDMAYVGPGPAVNGFLKSESNNIIILAGAASGGSSFVVRPDSGIGSAADLEGMIIAAPQIANTQDVSLRSYIARGGLETAERGGSVYVLNVANPEIHTLFAKGDIDAAWVPEPWGTILVEDLGGERLFREESLWPDGRFASVLLVARADYVAENPESVSDWLDAHARTADWIDSNPGRTAEIFEAFMLDLGAEFPPGVVGASFSNIEITADPIPESVETFAERAAALGYLGRGGHELDGIFHDKDVNSQAIQDVEPWQS